MNPVIFREYDIRGIVDRDFDASFAELLGKALCSFIQSKRSTAGKQNAKAPLRLSIGYDARVTSPKLAQALEHGMISSGAHVYRLGLVTTPISYFSCFDLNLDGGIMVTGSHNPPEYNGFKISVGKTTIHGADIQELKSVIQKKQFITGRGEASNYDVFPNYLAKHKAEFSNLKDIRVVLDCGNGAAGIIARRLFETVGLNPHILFEQPDGTFPNHHPDPTVEENLVDLKKAVIDRKAQIGIGFDGDSDRIGLVDENGKTILGDEMMVLIARAILRKSPGAKIIGDVKCSDRMYSDVKKHGGVPIMWKTGHSLVKAKIKEEKAPFGGELSGHIFFADRNFGYDDALYAGLRLIEILSETGASLSSLLSDLPAAHNTPEIRIDTTEEKKVLIVDQLKRHFANARPDLKVNLIDGIRVSYPDGWALARASNTQPVLVLRFESETAAGLKRIRSEFESVVQPLL